MVNTQVYRSVIAENVRACKFFVQVLHDTWGPPARNFEWKYNLARELIASPEALLEDVAVFFKETDGLVEPKILDLKSRLRAQQDSSTYDFESDDQFKQQLQSQLSAWLQSIRP